MTRTFHIVAVEGQRLFSRILQVLETQRVNVHAFSAETTSGEVHISATVSSDDDRAYRIEALLHRLEDVRSISIVPAPQMPKAG